MQDEWDFASLEKHLDALMEFSGGLGAAMTGAMVRSLGNEGFEELTERVLRTHQEHYFMEGVRILGLDKEESSDAILAAKYHYYSNMVGGLRMGWAPESD